MRIAVAGTHCSGKTTLVEGFAARHPEYVHEPEPYEWLVELGELLCEEPDAGDFYRQLELSVERLSGYPRGACVIAERSPLDFLAYLRALADLGRDARAPELVEAAAGLAAEGMTHVDLLVFLPGDAIGAPEGEDAELREAMNEALAELVHAHRLELTRGEVRVLELRGVPAARLAALERAVFG